MVIRYRTAAIAAKEQKTQIPRVTEELAAAFILMAEKIATRPCFSGYPFVEEMISDGYENALKAVNNYRIGAGEKTKVFSYFTRIITYAFVRKIKKEKKILARKLEIAYKMIIDDNQKIVKKFGSEYTHQHMLDILREFEIKNKINMVTYSSEEVD